MYKSIYQNHITQVFSRFDANHTKRLNSEELMNYYNAFNRHNAIPFTFSEDLVGKCLKKIDWNHDSGITRQEYQALLHRNLQGRPINKMFYPDLRDIKNDKELSGQVDEVFKHFDWDNSRKLNNLQLAAFYNALYKNAGILIQLTPQQASQALSLYGVTGLDAFALFGIIRQFKSNPKFIKLGL